MGAHTITITVNNLPATTITEDKVIYVDFPSSFASSIEIQMEISCQVQNTLGGTPNDYANTCQFISKKRLKIILTTDERNSATA